MKYTVKMRGKWCETHLRAKQMQNSAREKYKNMENEKSFWCNRQAGQWSNWWRIVCPRLWQKLWTKIFFRRHFLKIHVLPVPIMCPSCQLQWIFFSGSASELKIPLLKGFVPPTHFQKQVGWWNWLASVHWALPALVALCNWQSCCLLRGACVLTLHRSQLPASPVFVFVFW